jgi:long-chain fatty acid transport protein
MKPHCFLSRAVALGVVVSLAPDMAHAGALYFPEMSSASEAGYAGAGMVGRANDAGTVFSNPAGMMRFDEPAMMAGPIGVYIDAGFSTNDSNTATGRSGGVNKRIVPAGSFAYLRPLSDKVAVGVSMHNYFGLAIDWDDGWVGRHSATTVAVLAPQLQPTVAYRVNDWLSVGAGAAITMGYLRDKMRVQSPDPLIDDGKLRISDTDFAVQGNFAVMLEPWEHTRIGIRYLTETELEFEDAPDISLRGPLPNPDTDKIDLGMKMPQTLHAAIHHQFSDKLALLGSVGWEEFSRFGKIQVRIEGTEINTTLDEDFRDVWHFGVGGEYQYKPNWELTAGFSLDTSMSSDRTRPIVIPIGTMYRYAVGFKHKTRKNRVLGGGLTWVWEGNLPIKPAGDVEGNYKNVSIWVFSLSMSF